MVLELGGSDPFIVMPSANLDDAVATAVKSRVGNNGQSCIAAKRFIVAEEIADKFERAFVAKMEALKVGDPFDEKTDVGPLATRRRCAVAAGRRAKIRRRGRPRADRRQTHRRPGQFLSAHRSDQHSQEFSRGCEELFGPVASIFRVKNAEEAIRVANDHRYGLGASAWTNDDRERDPVHQ